MNLENFVQTCLSVALIFTLMGFVIFLVSMRRVKKQKNSVESQAMNLAVGDEVLFAGGIYGKVVKFSSDEVIEVNVCKGTNIEISRYSIQGVIK